MKDDLGNRIKDQYENRTRYFLPRRTYTIIRIDGKAFHTLTRNCEKPFDNDLIGVMNYTCKSLCEDIQGCKFGYVQSDEISLLLTDFDDIKTEAWFDGNIQKITSISASLATGAFNEYVRVYSDSFSPKIDKLAVFDSRVFTIPDPIEVENYFIWRQQDATRNSIQMLARSLYSHGQCENKNTSQLQEMCFVKGHNWDKLDTGLKRGRGYIKESYEIDWDPIKYKGKLSDSEIDVYAATPTDKKITRTRWIEKELPIFTQDRFFLRDLIPKILL